LRVSLHHHARSQRADGLRVELAQRVEHGRMQAAELLSAVGAVGDAFLQGRLHGAIAIQLALDMQHGDGDS